MDRIRLLLVVLLVGGLTAVQAQITISGTVTDDTGTPLIGASILAAGTTTGTVTDIDGEFSLTVPTEATQLTVSYTGFATQTVSLTDATTYSIVLTEDAATLSEVVVTGYGTQTRRRLTTSIASVDEQAFDGVPVTSFENALQGRLPGVTITSNSGTLGAQTSIRVRGIGSINSDNQPLFVVDGVILEPNIEGAALGGPGTNPLVNLNPNDIASVDVLKDAASAAIYGSRGANGVVLITTKSGSYNQDAQVTVGHYVGLTSPTQTYDLLSGPEYARYWNAAGINRGLPANSPALYANPDEEPDADWIDLVTRNGLINETNASVRGGTSNLTYYMGGTYRDEEGWIENTSLKRYSFRLNLEQRFGNKWTAGLNLNPTRTVNNRQNEDNNVASPLTYAALSFPNIDPFDENGATRGGIVPTSVGRTAFAGTPLVNLEQQDISLVTNQVLANTFVEFRPIENLSLRSSFGTQYLTLSDFQKSSSQTTDGFGSGGTASAQNQELLSYTWDNTASYLVTLDRSELDLLLGFSVQNAEQNTLNVNGNNFADDRLLTLNTAAEITGGGGFNTQYRFVGYLARAIYSFDDKLFVNLSARLDGSSRFGEGNQYGIFPAASVAYDFASDFESPFTQLKLRAGYGQTGNAGIGNFASPGLFGFGNDYAGTPGSLFNQLPNRDLTWETATTLDVAVDFALLSSRINGSVGYFTKTNQNLLLDVPQPFTNGIGSYTLNAGEIVNKGVEFNLNFDAVAKENFTLSFNLNGATISNEVTELVDNNGDGESDDIINGQQLIRVGEALGSWFLVEYAGVDPENGDALFLNSEGEATSAYIGSARSIVGNPLPDFTGGFGSNLRYKDLDFSFFFQAALGHQLYLSEGRFNRSGQNSVWNSLRSELDYWTPENTNTDIPQPRLFIQNGGQHSTRYLSDADFLRLRNVQLGYTFRNLGGGTSNLRLYVSGQNLLTITDFEGLDPESSGNDVNGYQSGNLFFTRPQTRAVTVGFNLNL